MGSRKLKSVICGIDVIYDIEKFYAIKSENCNLRIKLEISCTVVFVMVKRKTPFYKMSFSGGRRSNLSRLYSGISNTGQGSRQSGSKSRYTENPITDWEMFEKMQENYTMKKCR